MSFGAGMYFVSWRAWDDGAMSLFAELRRRNVVRVGVAYIAAAWLLIQVVETLFSIYELPPIAIRAVATVLAAGFIPALVFSWAFELTARGLERDEDVDHEASVAQTSGKKFERVIMIVLALGLGDFVVDILGCDPPLRRFGAQISNFTQEVFALLGVNFLTRAAAIEFVDFGLQAIA